MFASPTNKMFTGPLARFVRMVKNPLYAPMLDHHIAYFDPIIIIGNNAHQRVTVVDENNQPNTYIFRLSRQTNGPYRGCWMTDSVMRE